MGKVWRVEVSGYFWILGVCNTFRKRQCTFAEDFDLGREYYLAVLLFRQVFFLFLGSCSFISILI